MRCDGSFAKEIVKEHLYNSEVCFETVGILKRQATQRVRRANSMI